MSSESNGQKPESAAPPSGVVHRVSARAPSAWGAARLLPPPTTSRPCSETRASRTGRSSDLIPRKLQAQSGGELRGAFQHVGDEAVAAVGEHGGGLVARFDALLDAVAACGGRSDERATLAAVAAPLAEELEACADLLALLDRAASPVSTEVNLNLVARESGRMSGTARGREMIVQFEEASPDCAVATDPYVLGPLLSLLSACVQAAGAQSVVLRATASPEPRFVAEEAGKADAALPALALRVTRWVAPSAIAVRRIAQQMGASVELEGRRCSITLGTLARRSG